MIKKQPGFHTETRRHGGLGGVGQPLVGCLIWTDFFSAPPRLRVNITRLMRFYALQGSNYSASPPLIVIYARRNDEAISHCQIQPRLPQSLSLLCNDKRTDTESLRL